MPVLGLAGRLLGWAGRVGRSFLTTVGIPSAIVGGIGWFAERRKQQEQRRQQLSQQYQAAYERNPILETRLRQLGRLPQTPRNPTTAAASEVANWQRRLQAVGVEAPPPEAIPRREGLLQRAFRAADPFLFEPGRRAATFIGSLLTDRQPLNRQAIHRALVQSARAGRDPSQAIQGLDVIDRLAEQGNPLAQAIQRRRFLRQVVGTAYDIVTDPITYVTFGTNRVAAEALREAAEEAAMQAVRQRRIFMVEPGRLVRTRIRGGRELSPEQFLQRQRRRRYFVEIVEEGGRQRLRRLPASELPRDVIRGQTRRETNDRLAQMLLERRLERDAQRGLTNPPAEYLRTLERQAERKATRKITEIIPRMAPVPTPPVRTTLRFMGADIADLTPLRTAAGAVIQRLPGVTRVVDRLGRAFNFQHVPLSLPAAERAAVAGATRSILRITRRTSLRQSEAIKRTMQQWRELGFSPEVARRVPDIIQQTLKSADPTDERAVQLVEQFFKDQLAELHRMGIPVNVLENYVPHIYQDPRRARQMIAEVSARLREQAGAGRAAAQATRGLHARGRPFFLHQRVIETLEEAEKKYGLRPVRDARVMMAVYAAMLEQVRALREISEDLIRRSHIVSDRPLPGFRQIQADHVLGRVIPALQGKWIHPEIDYRLTNLIPLMTGGDEAIRGFVAATNRVVNLLKTLWLPVDVVRFNMQQAVGNIALNWADGVWNPHRYTQAALVLTERGRQLMPVMNIRGQQIPTEQIYQWFREAGLEGTGRASSFRSQQSIVSQALERAQREDLGRLRYYLGTWHGFRSLLWTPPEAIDNVSRMANFLDHLARGEPPRVAAESTRRALGDYSMLTPFERSLRQVVWFYPWVRFALPRTIERVLGAPGLLTGWAHIQSNAIRVAEQEYEQRGFGPLDVDRILPDWAKQQGAIPIGVAPDGTLRYILLDVPLNELASLPGSTDPVEWINYFLQQAQPIALAAPFLTGADPLTGQPITEAPQGTALRQQEQLDYILRQLGPIGRAVANIRGTERQLQTFESAMQGPDVPFVDPALRPQQPAPVIGVVRGIHPSYAAATQLFQARDYYRRLGQAIEATEGRVPTTEEVREGDLLGNPLIAVLNRRRLERGELPIGAQATPNPVLQALRAREIERAGRDVPGFIYEAMRATGVTEDWGPFLTYLMRTSSQGDVTRIGPPMPNGERPLGAFQIPPSIFQQYAVPGMTDPLNPLHNAVAFIRFVQARYGHPAAMPEIAGR